MTLLFDARDLSKSYAARTLFQQLSFTIFSGDRLGLIGPNGAGKSSLLKILAGLENPNSGILSPKKGLKIGYVPQTCHFPDLSPKEVLINALENNRNQPDYEKELQAEIWLSKLSFTGKERSADKLSGGWKKRLSIAKELIATPDLLLLDEPTNHLDLEGILWLEKFLAKESQTYILVSHDRYFLRQMTNKIIEVNPTYPRGMFAIEGSYEQFLEQREIFLQGQLQYERSLASKARREVDWLRKSPKARTTKSKSRVDEAQELLQKLSEVQERNRTKKSDIDFDASHRETRKLLMANNLSKEMGEKTLFRNLNFTLSPGTRIGLMGPNGSGKTTLLRLLAGEINPDQGTLKKADNLQIVYFDQHRLQLPDNLSLRRALSPSGDFVKFRGQMIHVNGWCKRFLFSPHLLDLPLSQLSGGERARLSIAHLMLQPADLLLLDEPTNDLDIPTLETLEENLLEFSGAVVLITHDRFLLEKTCTALLALGDLNQTSLFADFAQWEAATRKKDEPVIKPKEKKLDSSPTPKAKASYAEKREYAQMETRILQLETEITQLKQLLEDPSLAQQAARLQEICSQLANSEARVEQQYARWEELDKKLLNQPS